MPDIPVLILCGGLGTRIKEETEFRPKPMVPIGHRPILWHVMSWYAKFGFKRFVLCTGYKGDVIKQYFLHYGSTRSDFTIELATNKVTVHTRDHGEDWQVTVTDTGETNMTGSRIAIALDRFLGDAEHFAVSYGDGLTDADLAAELALHRRLGKIGTVLGVHPPSRFGEFRLDGNSAVAFSEKPEFEDRWINGGFFFFRREFRDYLDTDSSCVLEREPLARLADRGELQVYPHTGFWSCMDTQRDMDHLNTLWNTGRAPWRT